MSYLGLPVPLGYFEEYKRAAELTGHSSRIHYDAGKVLLGRWDGLAAEEKDFAAGLLKGALAGKGEERLADFLEAWNLAGRDEALIDRVLPDDAASLRTYARFLGERALSLEARRSALARAEAMDVARARTELDQARRDAESFRTADSSARCAAALEALGAVRFYQTLVGRDLFDPKEHKALLTAARRLLAMNRIEETRSLADGDGVIAAYLALEDDFTALGEFETFIKERGLAVEAGTDSPFKDLHILAFRMAVDFKLNRYRDIARVGSLLSSSSLVIAPSGRPSYAAILRLIGEANLKLDSLYEAERYYRMALEVAPDDLDVLLGLERCYGRLSDEAQGRRGPPGHRPPDQSGRDRSRRSHRRQGRVVRIHVPPGGRAAEGPAGARSGHPRPAAARHHPGRRACRLGRNRGHRPDRARRQPRSGPVLSRDRGRQRRCQAGPDLAFRRRGGPELT